jgi:hypothetical protein
LSKWLNPDTPDYRITSLRLFASDVETYGRLVQTKSAVAFPAACGVAD